MKVSLTDICDFQGGTQPPKDEWIDQPAQGYVRMLQIRDFTQSDKNYIEYVKDTGKLKTCIEDDILIGRYGASIGKILTGLAGAYNVAIVKTIPDEKVVSKKYLYWYLNSQYFQRFISNVGSRAAQAGFNKNDLGAAQIPLVDKERQEEICEVLEKANKLISLRKQQLAKLDELIKARFVEMFGDPVANIANWPIERLEKHLTIIGGYAFKSDGFRAKGIPVLRIGNINSGYFQPTNMVYWHDDSTLERYKMHPGDLVISLTGTVGKNDYGNVCILGNDYSEYYLNQRNAKLELNETLNGIYLSELLKFPQIKGRLTGISRGIRQANISNKDILSLPILIPPISLQKQFAAFVERVDQQKQTVQQSLEKLELMRKALMQEYFG